MERISDAASNAVQDAVDAGTPHPVVGGSGRLGVGHTVALRSLFDKGTRHTEDPDARIKNKLASEGAGILAKKGYQATRDAAIHVALQAYAWIDANGPVDYVNISPVDWVVDSATDEINVGQAYGKGSPERAKRRAELLRKRLAQFNSCLDRCIDDNYPDLPRVHREPERNQPTAAEIAEHDRQKNEAKLLAKTSKSSTTYDYSRDKRGRFKRRSKRRG